MLPLGAGTVAHSRRAREQAWRRASSQPSPAFAFSGQRDALLRAEAHRPGGMQQRPGVTGLLANHVQPGGHAAGQGDGLLQRGGEFPSLCALSLQ